VSTVKNESEDKLVRRPISSRNTRWAARIASIFADKGVKPNHISVMSTVFAMFCGISLMMLPHAGTTGGGVVLLVIAALAIQGRLLCNLFDGMVAVEGGFKTASGEIFNDFPDRVSDSLILICAGYAVIWTSWGPELGWVAALLAIMTAYARVLGSSSGAKPCFLGPMAKQHRMAVMTGASLVSIVEVFFEYKGWIISFALGVIALGSLITVFKRLMVIVKELENG